jgi:hypothetical protein
LSFHFDDTTAEDVATAKLAIALADSGHSVGVFTSEQSPLDGRRLTPSSGPVGGLTIQRVNGKDAVARVGGGSDARSPRNRVWGRMGAGCKLVHRGRVDLGPDAVFGGTQAGRRGVWAPQARTTWRL